MRVTIALVHFHQLSQLWVPEIQQHTDCVLPRP